MHVFVFGDGGFCSSEVLVETQSVEVTKSKREYDGATVESSFLPATVQHSSTDTSRSPLVSKSSDKDRVLRRSGIESTPEPSRDPSNISIRFSKKAAEDADDGSDAILAIKLPPPAVPDSELNETV